MRPVRLYSSPVRRGVSCEKLSDSGSRLVSVDLTAVDEELAPGDEAGLGGGKEEHRVRDLFGTADAAERNTARFVVE